MSRASNSFDGGYGWPTYGEVPLIRCPKCPCLERLVRLRCKKTENGNYGREFVKCESLQQPGKNLRNCTFFMWMGQYIEMLQSRGMVGSPEEFQSNLMDELGAGRNECNLLAAEMRNLNGNLRKIIDMKKQENFIVRAFYSSMVFITLLFVGIYYCKH